MPAVCNFNVSGLAAKEVLVRIALYVLLYDVGRDCLTFSSLLSTEGGGVIGRGQDKRSQNVIVAHVNLSSPVLLLKPQAIRKLFGGCCYRGVTAPSS